MLTADCGYNNTCLAYDTYDGSVEEIEGYCQFPEAPGDYCDTSGEASLYLERRSHKAVPLSRLSLSVPNCQICVHNHHHGAWTMRVLFKLRPCQLGRTCSKPA